MNNTAGPEPATRGSIPIFLLSFRHRDELADVAERAGWKAIAARRAEGAERRFIASGASVAVVDARGAYDEGLAAVRALADPAEATASALVVLLSRPDLAGLAGMFEAGATHFLASPFGEAELAQAFRFARRHADRLAGGRGAASGRQGLVEAEAAIWRWRPGEGGVALSPALGRRLGEGPATMRALLRRLDRGGRRLARDAIARLQSDARPTAFAHALGEGEGRVAHHLHLDASGDVVGRIEDLDDAAGERGTTSRDPLTGLADGQGARRWIEAHGPNAILILLAISRFDAINAAFGKATGDAVLQAAARRIERLVGGRRRLTARVAGAEFAVGLPTPTTMEEARLLASRLGEAVGRPFVCDHRVVTLASRAGIAVARPEGDDADVLLRRASAALAEAKDAEAGAVRVLDATGEAVSEREDRLEIDLRAALDRDEIEILFQPQVSIVSGAISGVEALARWRHPELGELGAEILFAAAERSDYLVQLSEHVQKKALALASAWPEALAHLRVALNVTAADMARADFTERLLAAIEASGVDRRRITVEITESGLIEDLADAAGLLAALRAAGLRVAIDDFGTGYSSLAYLKALPLDYLKIDQHLAQDITGSARDKVVVRGIIEMARSLGLAVIAEGVETEEQLALLAAEGCNFYQGFLCSPPVDGVALAGLVAAA